RQQPCRLFEYAQRVLAVADRLNGRRRITLGWRLGPDLGQFFVGYRASVRAQLSGWLRYAICPDTGFMVRNFRTSLQLGTNRSNRFVADLRRLGDGAVRLLRLRRYQLGDQLALLLTIKVPPMHVGRHDVGIRLDIVPPFIPIDRP